MLIATGLLPVRLGPHGAQRPVLGTHHGLCLVAHLGNQLAQTSFI